MDQPENPQIDYTSPPFHYVNSPEEIVNWKESDLKKFKPIHAYHKINFSPETITNQEFETLVYSDEATIDAEEQSERGQSRVSIPAAFLALVRQDARQNEEFIIAESFPELNFLAEALEKLIPGSRTKWDDGFLTIHTSIQAKDIGGTYKALRQWMGSGAKEKMVELVLERLLPKQERD